MKHTDKPIVDAVTLRRDLYFALSLLLADKELIKARDVVPWTDDFHEVEVSRLMLWTAVALRGFLDLLDKQGEEQFRQAYCGEYWPGFPGDTKEPLVFRQACNVLIHAKEVVSYLVPERQIKGAVRRAYAIRRAYTDRITVRGQRGNKATRAQIDILKFVQIADALIICQEANNANI